MKKGTPVVRESFRDNILQLILQYIIYHMMWTLASFILSNIVFQNGDHVCYGNLSRGTDCTQQLSATDPVNPSHMASLLQNNFI